MQKPDKVVKVICGNCGGKARNHEILSSHTESWDDDTGERGATEYQICKCRGCDLIRFREAGWNSYDEPDPFTGEIEPTVHVYPSLVQSGRKPIATLDLPDAVARIYAETVVAFNAGAPILAGGGLRAIVEAICIDQKVGGGNLEKKIDDLVAKGFLAKPQAELLHEERYLGNSALHGILPPANQEVEDGLDIVEGLITTIYILPLRAKRLRKEREKRSAK